ncbi:MAG: OmpH family outer membrane protein [Bacteroidetes bacterium]|nr:OmpH family outer membrane protein [Bacteroidota bacterium]
MQLKISPYLILGFFVVLIACVFYVYKSTPKIAYVRNLEVVYGYNGMKEARAEFQNQNTVWQSNLDTLKIRYQQALAYYQQNLKTFKPSEKEEQIAILKKMEADMKNYGSAVTKEAKDRDEKLTQGILNQINSFVQEYAKKNGYDVVLGAEGNGAILYGDKAYDITDKVLEGLNKDYVLTTSKNDNARK